MATTRWTDVVARIIEVQPEDDPAHRLDHQDIANIILRKSNYMVAMYNQDILRFDVPTLFLPPILTGALQYNLDICFGFVFDRHGHVLRKYRRAEDREALARQYGQKARASAS